MLQETGLVCPVGVAPVNSSLLWPAAMQTNTVVTSTPLSALLNIEHALVSKEFAPLADALQDISNTDFKALFLGFERERGNESFWAPYLQALPSDVPSTLFFSEDELEELQASLVGSSAIDHTYNHPVP